MIGNIYITGQIGTYDGTPGVELIDVIGQVKKQPEVLSFNVHINSEGGLVDVGFDIFNYLRSLSKPITTIGSGIVASIATVIFMAGSVRQVRENTPFMIHLPWGGTTGNADELELYTLELRKAEKQLTDFYKKELNLEAEAIQPLLKNETWLTPEQLTTLGFTNSTALQAVAKIHFNINNQNMITDKDRSWMEGLFNGFFTKFKASAIKNKIVQDANGAEIDFTDLADDAAIEVGAAATFDGAPAEGEYTLPDGTVYVFAAGLLTEIKEPETDELATANERIAELEAELETTKAEAKTAIDTVAAMKKDVDKLKSQVMSKFKVDEKKETIKNKTQDGDDKLSGLKEYLNKK